MKVVVNKMSALRNFRILDITCGNALCREIKSFTANEPLNESAVNSNETVDTILKSLNQLKSKKSIPTFLLYDEVGLQLFDKITRLDEYYLTKAERTILQQHADDIARRVNDGMNILELGSGSLIKTQLILNAMERNQKRVTYYALDLNQNELNRSLSSLAAQYNYVQLIGLLGTYDQAIPWIKSQCTAKKNAQHMILWLGSSIGSLTRRESAIFLRRFVRGCLQPGDLFVIGFDGRKDASTILNAYNDKQGVMGKLILNSLDHVNSILGEQFFNRDDFEYHSTYQENYGRHNFHLRAKKNVTLTRHCNRSTAEDNVTIQIEQGELIHVAYSHKYNLSDIGNILDASELDMMEMWSDSDYLYRLALCKYRPILSEDGGDNDGDDTVNMFFPYGHGAIRIRDRGNHNFECTICNT